MSTISPPRCIIRLALALCSAVSTVHAAGIPDPEGPTYVEPGAGTKLVEGLGFEKLLFIKRHTYHSSHFYTDFIDGCGRFGGNLCILDLRSGAVRDLLPKMSGGIFGKCDLSFDAKTIVFDWKAAPKEGFRIYECGIDGSGLRQLTHPPDDEALRIAKYDNSANGGTARMYHHQTDDMHPCYLPDGGIVFTSSRCEYGTLCDAPDHLATAVLFRMDGDGSHMQQLTLSPVSEFSPSVMEDGRILYTRWEYVDKGQLGIKCLWTMNPDGTGTREVYGNDIPFPPTMMHGRQIPGEPQKFVMLGTPHFPQSGIGTVILVDGKRPIRTREPMDYVTPWVDIRQEPGWNQFVDGRWVRHTKGPLYMDPFPLDGERFLVSHNRDQVWNDPKAYGLYLIDRAGRHMLVYRDEDYSTWNPFPVVARKRPPVPRMPADPDLAGKKLAVCVVNDVYHGLENVERGKVKWIRIMEQLPRPWSCRRRWSPAAAHTDLISRNTALAAKVLRGIVPVEDDGSAHFYVPADRNIYFSVLDEDYLELQRERTYVNYRPGERRSCIGCHETPDAAPGGSNYRLQAPTKPPVMPQPQPGDRQAARPLQYQVDVQPVLDRHCVECHSGKSPPARLNLTGELTRLFTRSYEELTKRRSFQTYREKSDFDGSEYVPAKTIGSYTSPLIAQVMKGCPGSKGPLPLEERLKLSTWVDASGVYYGSYWGRIHEDHLGHPNFRPTVTLEQALSTENPFEEWVAPEAED